jgi:hypothetical protein
MPQTQSITLDAIWNLLQEMNIRMESRFDALENELEPRMAIPNTIKKSPARNALENIWASNAGKPPLTDEEIDAVIQQSRAERREKKAAASA